MLLVIKVIVCSFHKYRNPQEKVIHSIERQKKKQIKELELFHQSNPVNILRLNYIFS